MAIRRTAHAAREAYPNAMNRQERRSKALRRQQRQSAAPAAALAAAIRRHRAGDLEAAEAAYVARLDKAPDDPDALHFLGILRHQQQRTPEGIALITRALAIVPGYVDAWNNLGNLHKQAGRLDDAEDAYRHAIALDDAHANAWSNLGVVLGARGQAREAIAALRRAIERSPRMTDAWFNLGGALRSCGLLHEAIDAYRHVLELRPEHARAHELLGRVLYLAGEHDAAATVFRSWVAVEPANPVPAHMLAACSGENVPLRASDAYVRTTFDGFADSFDEMLLQRLDYHAPELLMAALTEVLGAPKTVYDVLDAGCGTGLCGPLLEPYARSLTGVDLSPGMLAKARRRALYDELIEDELVHYLDEHAERFDVVASADTLCYFGDLAPVLHAARRALRAGGWLAFTVERSDDASTYRINPHGRYSHARAYVESVLQRAGFFAAQAHEAVLRRESGKPVNGWVVRARAAG
jgi:predicted TPR repeat methyltransferase